MDKIKKFLDTVPVDTVFYKKAGHGYINELSYIFYAENKVKISDACIVYCKLTNGGQKICLATFMCNLI